MFDLEQAKEKLEGINQTHLLQFWEQLNAVQKQNLLQQIRELDTNQIFSLQKLLSQKPIPSKFDVCNDSSFDDKKIQNIGFEELTKGSAGCLLVAGGQGTRLGSSLPKGLIPITDLPEKTLFQIFAERIAKASQQYQHPFPLAVMVSPDMKLLVQKYFKEHHYFGLRENQIFFFSQYSLPLLSEKKELFLDQIDHIAFGPSGNGDAFFCFYESGIWHLWKERGIDSIIFLQIDNLLANPLDPELIGIQKDSNADATIHAIFRKHPDEKVGILVQEESKTVVKEYNEISKEEKYATLPDGSLKHKLANISHFCFDMQFIREVAEKGEQSLPLHPAFKKTSCPDSQGNVIQPSRLNSWKFERFIFDVLPYSKKTTVLASEREQCYAPLKNKEDFVTIKTLLKDFDFSK